MIKISLILTPLIIAKPVVCEGGGGCLLGPSGVTKDFYPLINNSLWRYSRCSKIKNTTLQATKHTELFFAPLTRKLLSSSKVRHTLTDDNDG